MSFATGTTLSDTAAASLCVALVAVGVIIGRGNDTGSTHAAAPLTASRSSAP
jgi:hypothetical protein